jgi:hypothetical protein
VVLSQRRKKVMSAISSAIPVGVYVTSIKDANKPVKDLTYYDKFEKKLSLWETLCETWKRIKFYIQEEIFAYLRSYFYKGKPIDISNEFKKNIIEPLNNLEIDKNYSKKLSQTFSFLSSENIIKKETVSFSKRNIKNLIKNFTETKGVGSSALFCCKSILEKKYKNLQFDMSFDIDLISKDYWHSLPPKKVLDKDILALPISIKLGTDAPHLVIVIIDFMKNLMIYFDAEGRDILYNKNYVLSQEKFFHNNPRKLPYVINSIMCSNQDLI